MKLTLKTKIVIQKKFFFTMDTLNIDEDDIHEITRICDEMRYKFLSKLMNQEFISLKIEEAGFRSVNRNIIDEVRVEIYDENDKRITLKDIERHKDGRLVELERELDKNIERYENRMY